MYVNQPDEFSEHWAPYAVAALRIVTALLFLEHGTAKLLGFPATTDASPDMWSPAWITGVIELVGGLFLLIGLWTRWVGIILAIEMLAVYVLFHAGQSPFPLLNGGESALLFAFIFLALGLIGAGEWSVDKVMASKRSHIWGYAAPGGERSHDDE